MADDPLSTLDQMQQDFTAALARAAGDARQIEEVRLEFFGRSRGRLTGFLRAVKDLPPALRGPAGARANQLKQQLEELLAAAAARPATAHSAARPAAPSEDPTLPGVARPLGCRHPVTLVREELERIFLEMGYAVEDGPEAETDFNNFTALNIPADHPARDMQDTLYLEGGALLRTHTSPVQVRTMLARKPPLKIICPGRVFRRDAIDATHYPVFHQVEGLAVDRELGMADLKGTLLEMGRRLFGPKARVRLAPSYFPFVEPGAEFSLSCFVCEGAGCSTCKRSGWIEMGGAGMVHPGVFRHVGIDPEIWTGFAFGFGIDRIAMARYGIDDLRLLFDNDVRFLEQFRGAL